MTGRSNETDVTDVSDRTSPLDPTTQAVAGFFAAPMIVPRLTADPEVVAAAIPYLQARLCAVPAVGINFAFRGQGVPFHFPSPPPLRSHAAALRSSARFFNRSNRRDSFSYIFANIFFFFS